MDRLSPNTFPSNKSRNRRRDRSFERHSRSPRYPEPVRTKTPEGYVRAPSTQEVDARQDRFDDLEKRIELIESRLHLLKLPKSGTRTRRLAKRVNNAEDRLAEILLIQEHLQTDENSQAPERLRSLFAEDWESIGPESMVTHPPTKVPINRQPSDMASPMITQQTDNFSVLSTDLGLFTQPIQAQNAAALPQHNLSQQLYATPNLQHSNVPSLPQFDTQASHFQLSQASAGILDPSIPSNWNISINTAGNHSIPYTTPLSFTPSYANPALQAASQSQFSTQHFQPSYSYYPSQSFGASMPYMPHSGGDQMRSGANTHYFPRPNLPSQDRRNDSGGSRSSRRGFDGR